jgi:peptide/nickel transport system substrate-binding protein
MEPLAYFGPDGQLVPYLAAEIPSVENGGVAEDFTSVTWKLREGVKWHDGEDFTAEDVAFTFEYLSDPSTNATTLGFYSDVASVEAVDDYTVLITFESPVAAWFNPFVGASGTILPEHVLRDFVGEQAAFAPFNLMPIGTGPFRVVEFNPGDVAIYEIFMDYWDPGKPYFDRVELKGGGDAASAARAVLQSGEADWAWNLQVEATVLEQLESSGSGQLVIWPGAGTEKLVINHSDPETEQDGQRSHRDVPHPHLSVLEVRQAIALAIPRDEIAEGLYGDTAVATGYTMNENPDFMPPGITWEFDLEQAAALLDQAGALPNADGLRELNGRPMRWVSSASINSLRQKEQEIIKESLAELGIELEIAAIEASVYFDASNVDSFQHLYFDFGMERNSGGVFPINWYRRYLSADPLTNIAQQENGWSGRNFGRYQNAEFNELYAQAESTPEEADYIPIFHAMQQLVVDEVADIGLVSANSVAAAGEDLTGFEPSPFAVDVWDIRNWRRE